MTIAQNLAEAVPTDGPADDVVAALVALVRDITASELPPAAAHEVKRRVIDTLAIMLAGHHEPPSRATRSYALDGSGAGRSTVVGTGTATSPELAALANGAAMHSQDFMDTYLSSSGEACHPADIIPVILALAEHLESSPEQVAKAVVVAYEVVGRLCDAAQIRNRGWDHVTYVGIAAASACAVLLRLDEGALAAAISMATIPNVALRQTRNGEISMWKACAPAIAAQGGLRAARLASLGLRGPTEPFVGVNGFEQHVSGPLDWEALRREVGAPFKILTSHIKRFPVQYHTQAGIEAALAVRAALPRTCLDDLLTEVVVTTSQVSLDLTADSANKWSPETRETADHSMPYLVVTALREGEVDGLDFEEAQFRDPARLADMAKVRVEVDDAMSAAYPGDLTVRVQTTLASGTVEVHEVVHPLGHAARPMADADVEDKFRSLTQGSLEDSVADETLRRVWQMESLDSLRTLLSPIVLRD